jgi:fatty-acyl-CoA synthase
MSSLDLSIAKGGAEPALREISMAQLLRDAATRYPEHDAVVSVWQEKALTFEQLDAAASTAAAALIAFGIVPGDRVGIWSGNRLEWVIVQFAVAKIGAILVNINPAYRQTELGYVIEHAKCKALFLAPSFRGYSGIDAARLVRAASSHLEFIFLLDDSDHEQAIRWSNFLEYGKNLKRSA